MRVHQHLPTCVAIAASLFLTFLPTQAQEPTVGLIANEPAAYPGYTLFSPMPSNITYLINNEGQLIHTWESEYQTATSVYLLDNGDLLKTGYVTGPPAAGGMILRIAWDGTVLWQFPYFSTAHLQHHDIQPLPNGNVLILAWEFFSSADAIQAGRDPASMSEDELWPEKIVEIHPTGPTTGEVVWEWHLWDHLIQDFDATKDNYGVVGDHPELVDINFRARRIADWIHCNSIDYNPELDQIIMSCNAFMEIWIIDHSTTTAQAASHTGGTQGHGGDLLYRWGNPQAYRAGSELDKRLFRQHNARWITPGNPGAGNITLFNNGTNRPDGSYSTVDEITPPVDGSGAYTQPAPGAAFGPTDLTWTFVADPPEDVYSPNISGAQRLPNNNTLICVGATGRFLEVMADLSVVWEYINPVSVYGPTLQGDPIIGNAVFRCERLAPDHPGLVGKDLSPVGRVERYPISITGTEHIPTAPTVADSVFVRCQITADSGLAATRVMIDAGEGYSGVDLFDDGEHGDGMADDGWYGGIVPPISAETVDYYIAAIDNLAGTETDPAEAPVTTYTYFLTDCCSDRVGDANGLSGDEPTISDVSTVVDALFISGDPGVIACLTEADLNQSGGSWPQPDDITIADVSILIDYLFITGPSLVLPDCL